jgi:GNAT superfamily N-acetyltransferase
MRLYSFFHPEETSPAATDPLVQKTWQIILADPNQRYYGVKLDGRLISTCLMTIVPNLTRGTRPYGLIENVITDPVYRKQGHATRVLQFALNDAWADGCYKVMLLTGSKTESTLRFYEKSGFQRNVKTGFVAYPAKH